MTSKPGISLGTIIDTFNLEVLYGPEGYREKLITIEDVNRPGLQLAGFFDYFDENRMQVIGLVETSYLQRLTRGERRVSFHDLFAYNIPAVIYARDIEPFPECVEMAQLHGRPLLRTQENTANIISNLVAYLHTALSPSITRHGVLVEVYGEGVLLMGESGVGKSETAIELLKRGHRLIADDAVEIKRVSATTLIGSAPEIIRHYVELRGIGIVDVRRLFGMGSVKQTEKIDLVVNLEPWQDGKMYDRLGLDEETTDILGIKVPSIVIPVCPGRNLSIVIEVAAMNNRQKRMGYNTAAEFNQRLMKSMGACDDE